VARAAAPYNDLDYAGYPHRLLRVLLRSSHSSKSALHRGARTAVGSKERAAALGTLVRVNLLPGSSHSF
jgi:hypothetical protein